MQKVWLYLKGYYRNKVDASPLTGGTKKAFSEIYVREETVVFDESKFDSRKMRTNLWSSTRANHP